MTAFGPRLIHVHTKPDMHYTIEAIEDGHYARCETCDRPLYAGIDTWETQRAPDADGETTVTICQRCIDAAMNEGA